MDNVPQILKDMDMVKKLLIYGNAKGTHANREINKWGRLLQVNGCKPKLMVTMMMNV
jgi:hypothetical protein